MVYFKETKFYYTTQSLLRITPMCKIPYRNNLKAYISLVTV